MKLILLFLTVNFCALFVSGCGNEMIIVKAQPQRGSESIVSEQGRWKSSYKSGTAHYKKREYNEALEFFAVALKFTNEDDDRTRARIYFSMGQCWEGLRDIAKAEQNYIMAQNLDPNHAKASDALARITKRRAQKE